MGMKFYILSGPQKKKEHCLDKEIITVGRQDKENSWYPDIDLSPDKRISRKHFQVSNQANIYKIKDLGSKHGTLVNGEEIKEAFLLGGSEVKAGDTVLKFEPESSVHIESNGLKLDFEFLEIVNFALLHCGFAFISNLKVKNSGSVSLEPQDISFFINGYSEEKIIASPLLNPGDSRELGDVDIKFDALRLEGQVEKTNTQLFVKIKDKVVLRKDVTILAYNEFSLEEELGHQVSLVGFVQPQHPLVKEIVSSAGQFAKLNNPDKEESSKQILQAIYNHLCEKYDLHYDTEMSYAAEKKIQKIRLAHHILEDVFRKSGRGTCVDFSILLAACLENLGLKPLIILVRNKEETHAFVGCWEQGVSENISPLLLNKDELLSKVTSGEILLIECTGFCQGKQRLSFDSAVAKASETLKNKELAYALDICAARKYGGREGISPLPFVGTPHYSEIMEKVFHKAKSFAIENHSKVLGTPHLLLGLLELKDGIMRKIFLEQGIDPLSANRKIMKGLQNNKLVDSDPKPTYHYEEVLNIAGILARRQGSAFVEEHHLIEALLEVRSDSLEAAFRALSTTPQQFLRILYQLTGQKSSFTNSRSFFCDN